MRRIKEIDIFFQKPLSLGDFRTDENIALAAQQTIWVREHNRVAEALKQTHPTWDPETLFQEARRIVVAEYQHIIYNEYLPILVGECIFNSYLYLWQLCLHAVLVLCISGASPTSTS